MTEILKVISLSALIKANEANLYALSPFFHDWPEAEKYIGPDLSWCVTGIPFAWCNVAFGAHLRPDQVDEAIEGFVAEGEKRKVPLSWWVGQETLPSDLGNYLVDYGFIPWSENTLMAVDLYAMKEDVTKPHAFTITQVEDPDSLRIWCNTAAEGFGIPDSAENLFEWFGKGIDLGLPLLFYLGLLDGKPVATSVLFLAEGVAGVYFVATLPGARRRGIGYSVTLEPLREARKMGYGVGVLQASGAGIPVYRKMGFRECCKMRSYLRANGHR